MNHKELMKLADSVCSDWVRLRDSVNGYVACFICGTTKRIAEMQNGHFMRRGKLATRFNEINCQVSCEPCNLRHENDRTQYTVKMMNRYGQLMPEKLELMSNRFVKYSREDLKGIIKEFRTKIKNYESHAFRI